MIAFLTRQRELWDPAVVEQLYEQVARVARIDVRAASRLADGAAWLAARLGDKRSRAQSLRASGHVLRMRGRYRDALQRYRAALRLFRAAGDDVGGGRTLSGGALQCLILLGRYQEAQAAAREARRIFTRHGDTLRLARLDSNVGNIFFRRNRFAEALVLYERAHRQLVRVGEPQDVAAVLSNTAVCCTFLNDFDKALDRYREARAYCQTHDLPLLIAYADYNIAYLHCLRGEYNRALVLYRSAEQQSDRAGDPHLRALCDLDRSELYLELNLDEESGELAARAVAKFDQLGLGHESAMARTLLAAVASRDGHSARALELLDRACELFTTERNQIWLALVGFAQALVLYDAGRIGDARGECRRALGRFTRASLPGKAALCELLLARLALEDGNTGAADRACGSALKHAAAAQSPMLTYRACFVLGLIREAQGEPRAAYAAYERSRASLEQLRSQLGAEHLSMAFLKDKIAVYESVVAIGLALGSDARRHAAAFDAIEQGKSRSLADLIAFRAGTLAPRVETARSTEVHRLRQRLTWHARQIAREEVQPATSPRRIAALRRSAESLEKRLIRTVRAVRADDQEFAALQGGAACTLDEIREALTDDTVLLEYYEARGQIYACVVDRKRLEVVPIASMSEVRDRLRLLQFQLSRCTLGAAYPGGAPDRRPEATHAHLAALYTLLVAPIRDRLQRGHLVIVPHGALHGVPFHALFDGTRFLVDAFTISYAPSASVYRLCRAAGPRAGGEALIMGVPDGRAPYIENEVQAVGRTLPGARVFVGDEATAERLATLGPASRFIHLSTHGFFRRDNPMFSSIRLGSGPLDVIDLYEMRLAAELVTLSGCSTGLSVVSAGDELVGLVRGLLYAGAQAVMVTLWDACDESTAVFMEAFYRNLASNTNKARAAQLAMESLRARYPHPFYWAPFILVGDVRQP
jgi:CHAT domain-containing protein